MIKYPTHKTFIHRDKNVKIIIHFINVLKYVTNLDKIPGEKSLQRTVCSSWPMEHLHEHLRI